MRLVLLGLARLRADLSEAAAKHTAAAKKATPANDARAFALSRDALLPAAFVEIDEGMSGSRLADAVKLKWSGRLTTTAGITRLRQERDGNGLLRRVAAIELSTHVVDTQSKLRSTLAHELCHAAAWVLDGVSKPAHGKTFKDWGSKVSAAFPDIVVQTTHNYYVKYKYRWRCDDATCDYTVGRQRNTIDVRKHVCPRCASRLVRDSAD